MQLKYKITKLQLFSLLFLNPIILTLTYSKEFFLKDSESILDFILSAAFSYILTFILVIPSYLLYKKYPNFDLFKTAKLKKINTIFYSSYFIWVCVYFVSIFRLFVLSVLPYDSQIFLISLLMCITIIYSSFKGINSIARTSVIVFSLIAVSLLLILSSLLKKVEVSNFPVFMENDKRDVIDGLIYMLSRHFSIPVLVTLLPLANTKPGKIFFLWNTSIHLFFSSIVIVFTGALGKYLDTQIFPFYSATRVASIGVFRRLDTIYIGIFVTGVLIIASLFFYIFKTSLEGIENKNIKNFLVFLAAISVVLLGCFLDFTKKFKFFIYNENLLLLMLLVTSVFLPAINLITENFKKKGYKKI